MQFLPSVVCETSTVADGNMDFRFGEKNEVINNRTAFLEKHGVAYGKHIAMRGEHDDTITLADDTHKSIGATSRETQVRTEVLVTKTKGLALLLTTADCQGVSFYDPVSQTIALAHISRKTLLLELPRKTVEFLKMRCDVQPENLLVHIGPSIRKSSYVFALPLQTRSPLLESFIEEKAGAAHIDLIAANQYQLHTCGVRTEHVTVSPEDTASSPEYFSYYNMQKGNESKEARMANVLMMQ